MIFSISQLTYSLFTHRSYVDLKTGLLKCETWKPSEKERKQKEWHENLLANPPPDKYYFPYLSNGYIRQQYLDETFGSYKNVKDYGINKYPRFSLNISPDLDELEHEFVSKTHCYCEDNNIEDAYWDFASTLEREIAIKWCEENGHEWIDS